MALQSDAIRNNMQNPSMSHAASGGRGVIRGGNGSALMVSEGQVLKGVVTDIHGNQITIQMDDGTNFTGQLADASNYSIGQGAAFQVTGTSSGVIYMQAITDAYLLGLEDTINQALEEASLPKSPRNVEIVRSLLISQQSISRQNIADNIRLCAQFPNNNVNSVITAKYLSLPMTEQSISQLEHYQNQTHQLLYKMESLTDSVNQVLDLVGEHAPSAAGTIGGKILDLALTPSDFLEDEMVSTDISANEAITAKSVANEAVSTEVTANEAAEASADEAVSTDIAMAQEAAETVENEALMEMTSDKLGQGEIIYEKNQLGSLLSPEARAQLTELTDSLALSEEIKAAISDGTISNQDFLTALRQALPNMSPEQASALISNKDFQMLVKEQLMTGWSITPKAFAKKENIEKLYHKLDEQLTTLSKLSQTVSSQSAFKELGNTALDMQNNLHFMKELNQTFSYLQIPLRLQEENAHGDLYVMTKKGALKNHPDKLSVLLHLEMEHLGELDIHIKKDNSYIETKFFVEDKKTRRLLETNIELLRDAMNEQGYSFTSEFSTKDKDIDIVKDFIAQDKPIGDMKRYSFDLRA